MFLKKIKNLIREHISDQRQILAQTNEVEWAMIYHDSIRGKAFLENLPLNIGRWAGNYSFFYVLNRVLSDFRPLKILDMGLGESSKFISTYLENQLHQSSHTVIEQNSEWITLFKEKFTLTERSTVIYLPLVQKNINSFQVNSYDGLEEQITGIFDLYIVDGPFGSDRFSRFDIIGLLKRLNPQDEFMIIMDDMGRRGEQDTFNEIGKLFKTKGIAYTVGFYEGNKSVAIIASDKYKYATSL